MLTVCARLWSFYIGENIIDFFFLMLTLLTDAQQEKVK